MIHEKLLGNQKHHPRIVQSEAKVEDFTKWQQIGMSNLQEATQCPKETKLSEPDTTTNSKPAQNLQYSLSMWDANVPSSYPSELPYLPFTQQTPNSVNPQSTTSPSVRHFTSAMEIPILSLTPDSSLLADLSSIPIVPSMPDLMSSVSQVTKPLKSIQEATSKGINAGQMHQYTSTETVKSTETSDTPNCIIQEGHQVKQPTYQNVMPQNGNPLPPVDASQISRNQCTTVNSHPQAPAYLSHQMNLLTPDGKTINVIPLYQELSTQQGSHTFTSPVGCNMPSPVQDKSATSVNVQSADTLCQASWNSAINLNTASNCHQWSPVSIPTMSEQTHLENKNLPQSSLESSEDHGNLKSIINLHSGQQCLSMSSSNLHASTMGNTSPESNNGTNLSQSCLNSSEESFKLPISVRTAMLQLHFMKVKTHLKNKTSVLLTVFREMTQQVETARMKDLEAKCNMPWTHPQLHAYYDYQHHLIISRVERSLALIDSSNGSKSSSSKKGKKNNNSLPERMNNTQNGQDNLQKRKCMAPRDSSQRFVSSFNPVALRIMNNWYERNQEHPYPSGDTCEVIAKASGITTEQVKRWFANRRMREGNTRNLGQIAKEKRKRMTAHLGCTQTAKKQCLE